MDMGGGALLHPPETLRGHEQHRHDREHDRDHDHEDDLGPETSVDDGELQRQQLADLDPAAEPRQEAPTPPAASLLPGQSEADNVADSGEDSDDEWNYFKVEPSEKAVDVQSLVQAKQSVCPETTQLDLKAESDDSIDMESRLNPDAAEFVPSPTHSKPSFEDTIISQSPTGKIIPLDDVEVPSMAEFQQEISQRPGDITSDDALSNDGLFSPLKKDLINGVNITVDTVNKQCDDLGMKLTEQNLAVFTSNNPFEVSEVSSTKAEYGDESANSFVASDFIQKNLGSNTSNADSSLTEMDFVLSETSSKLSQEPFGFEAPGEFSDFRKGLDTAFLTNFTPIKDVGTISFEVQKEIAPTMEECPERVKLTDDMINPFSHEQPIAESPAEESEQLPEQEKANELNESFEHSPNFTLDAFEVTSPLNPCAPSFDYQVLDDTGNEKAAEMSKSIQGAVDQTFTHALEAVSGSDSSVEEDILAIKDNFPMQSAGEKSPDLDEKVDLLQPIKNSEPDSFQTMDTRENGVLQKNSKIDTTDITTSYPKLKEVSNMVEDTVEMSDLMGSHGNNTEFEQQFQVDNLVTGSERELNEPLKLHEDKMLDGEFHKDYREMEQQVTEEYKEQELLIEQRESHGISQEDEFIVIGEPSTETNEHTIQQKVDNLNEALHEESADVEELSKFSEGPGEVREPDMPEKEKADFLDKLHIAGVEQAMDTVHKVDFQEEAENHFSKLSTTDNVLDEVNEGLLKGPVETLGEPHKMLVGLIEFTEKPEDSAVEKLQQDSSAILENLISKDLPEQNVVADSQSEESNEKLEPEESKIVSHLSDELSSLPAAVAASVLESISNLDVNGSLSADDVYVEGKDRSSQMFSEETEIKDIPEKMLPKLTTDNGAWPSELSDVPEQLRVCVFPLPVKQNETDVELVPPSLMGNEEMEDTRREVIEEYDNDTCMQVETLSGEQRDMMETLMDKVSNKLQLSEGEVKSSIAANEEHISGGINEKTEQITEEVIERKDNLNLEATFNKLALVSEASDHTQSKTCDEASSEVTEVSEPKMQEDEPNKEIQEGTTQEGTTQDIRTPPPTPASQADLTINRELPDIKASTGPSVPEPAAAAAAVAIAAVGIAGTAVAASVKKESTLKRLTTATTKDAKKTPTVKEPERLKSTKTSAKPSPSTVKVASKTSPTSPTKLSVASTPRTSTPKKTPTLPSTAVAKAAPKVPVTTTKPSRPSPTASKPASVPASQKSQLSTVGKVASTTTVSKTSLKTASSVTAKTTVRSASAPKPRVSGTATSTSAAGTGVKTTLTNGDIKPADAKKSTAATTKAVPRSHTAPPRTTASKTVTGMTAGSVAKSGIQARTGVTSRTSITNGVASKPRVPTSTAAPTRTAVNLPAATDKQHKETANKHISARRVGTVPSKTAPAKVGVKKTSPTTKGAKAVPPANGGSPLISAGEGDKKKTDPLL